MFFTNVLNDLFVLYIFPVDSFDKIREGEALKLFMNASVAGQKMNFSFFNLSVFWYKIVIPANARRKHA